MLQLPSLSGVVGPAVLQDVVHPSSDPEALWYVVCLKSDSELVVIHHLDRLGCRRQPMYHERHPLAHCAAISEHREHDRELHETGMSEATRDAQDTNEIRYLVP